jgi:hypothetical protein
MKRKIYRNQVILVCIAILFLTGCNRNNKKIEALLKAGIHTTIVQEVLQTSQYSYFRLSETGNPKVKESDTIWVASTYSEPVKGDTLYYKGGLPMFNFRSKELNRGFKKILFLDSLSKQSDFGKKDALIGRGHDLMSSADKANGGVPKMDKIDVKIDKVAGGVTIADLYGAKESYAGKSLKVKGQVTKFSPEIMGKNWLHIQDGTLKDGKFDMAITTDLNTKVKVGDVVCFEGKLSTDKQIGQGYFYEVIMEDAVLVK